MRVVLFRRYMGNPEKALASLHTSDCPSCREVSASGREISKPTNPTYPCILNVFETIPVAQATPYPFPLAGLPGDRQERTLVMAMKILVKIMITNHPVYIAHEETLCELLGNLLVLRTYIWYRRKGWPVGHKARNFCGESEVVEIGQGIENLGWKETCGGDQFRLWSLFCTVFLFSSTSCLVNDQLRLRSPLASVRSKHHHLLHKVGEAGYLEMVDKVLDLISDHLVPYDEVMKAMCGGTLQRACGFCGKLCTVKEVLTTQVCFKVPQVVVWPTAVGLVSCNRRRCANKLGEKLKDDNQWRFVMRSNDNVHMCDNCFQGVPIQAIHRCSQCLKKQYCSQACIVEDRTKGHTREKFCRKEGEERKVKGGRGERVKKNKEQMQKGIEYREQVHREASEELVKMVESFKKNL